MTHNPLYTLANLIPFIWVADPENEKAFQESPQ